MPRLQHLLILCGTFAALSACSSEAAGDGVKQERDPVLVRALHAPLMTDPDLSSHNEANAALTIGFEQSLPPIDRSPDTIAAARDAARLILIEGGDVPELPAPQKRPGLAALGKAMTAEQRAELVDFAKDCASKVEYSALWAARLPQFATIVPRGAVIEAAGSDGADCQIRSITYLTPLSEVDVLTFHYTQAKRAGLSPIIVAGEESAIEGAGEAGSLALHVQPRVDGLNAVHVVAKISASGG